MGNLFDGLEIKKDHLNGKVNCLGVKADGLENQVIYLHTQKNSSNGPTNCLHI